MSDSKASLQILQISASDMIGGAGRIAWLLHQGYRERGYHSSMAVEHYDSDDPAVIRIPHKTYHAGWMKMLRHLGNRCRPVSLRLTRLCYRLAKLPRKMANYQGHEDFYFPGTWHLLDFPAERPDILHGHNLHGNYFDLRALPWLSRQVPMVLTLHDDWMFTGHCACTIACERWRIGCGNCPDLHRYPAMTRDGTSFNWHRKQRIYAQSQCYIATPSRWLMNRVERSMLAPAMVEGRVIPNGIDLSIFQPGEQHAARRALDLPHDAKILLFAANVIRDNVYKDYQTIRSAIERLAYSEKTRQPLLLLALGDSRPDECIGERTTITFIPHQNDPHLVAQYYQAADVFVHATKSDTFPTTILETLACGTPAVATAVGGIPEQIDHGKTGLLTPPGDAEAMAAALQHLFDEPTLYQSMRHNAAAKARTHFSAQRMVEDYLAWYQEILDKRVKISC